MDNNDNLGNTGDDEVADQGADYKLREDLRSLIERKLITQAQLAREVDVSGSAVSQWIAGKYAGDSVALEGRLQIWLDSYRARQADGRRMPTAPSYQMTPTGMRVMGAISYAQDAADIAVVYGAAGVGKTSAIRAYVASSIACWVVTMTPAMSSVVTALEEICEALGISEHGGAARLYRAILRKVRNSRGVLLIDEAQHLSQAAFDQIRAIHDDAGIGLVFVGNEELAARLMSSSRSSRLDRLTSRIGKVLRLTKPVGKDIDGLIDAWGIKDAKCRQQLHQIATGRGALRTLTKVLRLAAMNAAAEKASLCCEHVARASRELGGVE